MSVVFFFFKLMFFMAKASWLNSSLSWLNSRHIIYQWINDKGDSLCSQRSEMQYNYRIKDPDLTVLSILSFILRQNLLARDKAVTVIINIGPAIGDSYVLIRIHTVARKEWQSWVCISFTDVTFFLMEQNKNLPNFLHSCCYPFLIGLMLYYSKVII